MDLDVVLLDEGVDDLEGGKEAPPEQLLEAHICLLFKLAWQFKVVVLVALLFLNVYLVLVVLLLLWLVAVEVGVV